MPLIPALKALLGETNVLTGPDTARYARDWMGTYEGRPLAVARPGSTAEVAATVKLAADHGIPVIPISGNTGLTGATYTEGGLLLSTERLNRIREIRPASRLAIVESGVILSKLHDAAADHGLYFPLWFGARGSAMIGGVLSTNAGGSNVLRYGSTRALCLGLEVVLPDGQILDLMSELHKDNSGYDLKDLFIGAEGTLGIITAAVMKLVPAPRAHATATLAARSLPDALLLLNRLQAATGGLVEAFEYMPADYMTRLEKVRPDLGIPFPAHRACTILVELAATAPALTTETAQGTLPLTDLLEDTLAALMEEGLILDATLARSTTQRAAMWARREAAAELGAAVKPMIDSDIALPLDKVETFLTRIAPRLADIAPGAETLTVAHLGDGNLHFSVYPGDPSKDLYDRVITAIEDIVQDLGGSFSAEHGVGLSKRPSMARRKNPVALDLMHKVKQAIDPANLMNPGKVLPPR
ncbi:MAG: FAD-binding oxidoreductase [Rhodobacteraceae bacterium]|nr:FAD-binding oxidoreductase [Paracoccaceae bacterium]